MAESDLALIEAFQERFAKAQASEVIELPCGFALLQKEFPASHDHNRVEITSAAASEDILSTVDSVLGDAALNHRFFSLPDHLLPEGTGQDFLVAGYEAETIATMIYRGAPAQLPTHDVQAVSAEILRPALMSNWKASLPDVANDVHEQLADRVRLYDRGATVARLVVFQDDVIAAHVDLFIDSEIGIAQIENLNTHSDYRGRGYAGSLVSEAQTRAEDAECQLLFLAADLDDWPFGWYQRLGFVDVAHTHYYTRA